jgi:hypothetical protein
MPTVLLLRRTTPAPGGIPARAPESDTTAARPSEIRCPLCLWVPTPRSRWYCCDCGHPEHYSGGCGMAWNTFETHGRCPGCDHQWRWTACLSCHEWSLHEDWYVKAPKRLH